MHIRIIAVGKIKERYLTEGIAEYEKRLQPYTRLSITEVNEERRPVNPSPAQQAQSLAREGDRILAAIPEGSVRIALVIDGKPYSSEGLAGVIRDYGMKGAGTISFIIGGDLGLSPVLTGKCDLRFSLAPLTFTHPMVRLILLEQIYRAFRIIHNEPYHR